MAKQLGLIQTAGEGEINTTSIWDDLKNGVKGAPDLFNGPRAPFNPNSPEEIAKFQKTEINLYVDKLSTDGSVDLSRWIQKAYEMAKIEESKKVGG